MELCDYCLYEFARKSKMADHGCCWSARPPVEIKIKLESTCNSVSLSSLLIGNHLQLLLHIPFPNFIQLPFNPTRKTSGIPEDSRKSSFRYNKINNRNPAYLYLICSPSPLSHHHHHLGRKWFPPEIHSPPTSRTPLPFCD